MDVASDVGGANKNGGGVGGRQRMAGQEKEEQETKRGTRFDITRVSPVSRRPAAAGHVGTNHEQPRSAGLRPPRRPVAKLPQMTKG